MADREYTIRWYDGVGVVYNEDNIFLGAIKIEDFNAALQKPHVFIPKDIDGEDAYIGHRDKGE